jgi:hypothetical protein
MRSPGVIDALNALFKLVEAHAAEGKRCPTNDEIADYLARTGHLSRLKLTDVARSGRIKIEVYAKNFRVVEICDGPHRGKRTQDAPHYQSPYRVITGEEIPTAKIRKEALALPGDFA